jgi:hypothetical protein
MNLSKKLSFVLSVAALAVTMSACKSVDTPDGKIPAEYVDMAKTYEGTYEGQFDGLKGELTFKMD